MTVIAAGVSATGPLPGQSHRSGPNFQLLSNNGQTVSIQAPTGVVFDIKQDVTGTDPTPVSDASNGTQVGGGVLETGKNYYIANPRHATTSFAVILTQG